MRQTTRQRFTPMRLSLAAAGAVALITLPATTLGQQRTDQDRNDRRMSQRDSGQDRAGSKDIASILASMEGMWRIEVRMDHEAWQKASSRDSNDRLGRHQRDRHGSSDGDPTTGDGQARVPQSSSGQKNQDRTHDADDSSSYSSSSRDVDSSLVTWSGVADTSVILGETILRERFYLVPGEAGRMRGDGSSNVQGTEDRHSDRSRDRGADDRSAEDWSKGADGKAMRGLAFFDLDPETDTYQTVFMNDRTKCIKTDQGRYEVQGRKIVFHGRIDEHAGNGQRSWSSGRERGDEGDRNQRGGQQRDPRDLAAERDRSVMGNQSMRGSQEGEPARIVLEMLSDDEYQVTMYDGTRTLGSPASDPRPSSTRSTQADDAGLADGVIYHVTYTRISGQSPEIRRMLDDGRLRFGAADRPERDRARSRDRG